MKLLLLEASVPKNLSVNVLVSECSNEMELNFQFVICLTSALFKLFVD